MLDGSLIPAMHIPDGFMSPRIALLGWLLAVPAVGWALWPRSDEEEGETSLAALLAAFLFAAQTFHFPVPGGTSGHLVGATLVVILCGARMGLTILAAVIILQAIVFGDGGLYTLGWNLTNMGLASGLVGGALYQQMRRRGLPVFGSAFVAAWVGTQMGALCTAMELSLAGVTPLKVSLAAMMAVQAVMGLGEGLVTASAVSFLLRVRPNLVSQKDKLVWPGLAVVCAVGICSAVPPSFYGDDSIGSAAAFVFLAILLIAVLSAGVLSLFRRSDGRKDG
ncbi:MAG: energy-coupling factor ABC transporter permease [Candidatus Eremiobacteraeota bacterium]|nr:energy-coupling factor ABC transporter permease [Candidatus Eremiobacteraeota bacterium]